MCARANNMHKYRSHFKHEHWAYAYTCARQTLLSLWNFSRLLLCGTPFAVWCAAPQRTYYLLRDFAQCNDMMVKQNIVPTPKHFRVQLNQEHLFGLRYEKNQLTHIVKEEIAFQPALTKKNPSHTKITKY